MEKIKVCVADDNRELVSLLSEYIEGQEDMEVIGVAYNGQECLSLFKEKDPDVLVLDIIMPHLDGLAVLERLRESDLKKQPNVIMLTAFGQEDVTKKAVDLGASYFILKPFDMENLVGHIRQVSGNASSVTHRAPSSQSSIIRSSQPEPKKKISTRASQALSMKSASQPILKAISICAKPSQWYTMTSNCSAALQKSSIRTSPKSSTQPQAV